MKAISKAILMILSTMMLSIALCACGGSPAASSPASNDASGSSSSSAASSSNSTNSAQSSNSSAPVANDGKTLVAYFSATGNTAPLAQYAADALDADIFEITPVQPYTSEDLNYNDNSTRATVEQRDESARPEISGDLPNMDAYDTVVLAYPIWWGDEPRIMDTFVENVDLGGKTVVAFCTSGGSGIGSSDKNLAALADPSATWLQGARLNTGASAAEVESWLKSIGLL